MTFFATDIALITREAAVLPSRSAWTGIGYLVQISLSLLIILALIYVTLKFLLPKLTVSTKGKMIQVLDRIGLEPSVGAYILQVGRQNFLIVVSSKNVTYIDKVDVTQ
jgi:flagellar biogenesis protein FliO